MIPHISKVFNAFTVDPKTIKLCIVGQDPYPSKKHATGYAFDLPEGTTRSSFQQFVIAGKDYGIKFDTFDRIKLNVFLLNANLTTNAGVSKVHDWTWFTSLVIKYIKLINPSCKFVYLGKHAQTLDEDNSGIHLYHPAANPRSGKKLFNKSFFKLTEDIIPWKTIYHEIK